MAETIHEQDSALLYRDDMVKYLIIVNRRRAFPEIIDGFKPIQRKLIYDMFKQGATSYTKRIKSQAIVGDTMKLYYDHGDASLYGGLEPMANWYKIKMPLIAPKGNWGSLMGDGPAAARYTEAGLSDFCYDCIIGELKDTKRVVDWVENSRGNMEPEYLPVKLPILLINGSFGIGVGMNTNIPTHNLIEVCEATRKLLHDPNYDVILAPDACQPCHIIIDEKEMKKISHTGMGVYKVRGNVVTSIEKDHPIITITSLPDGISTDMITSKLNDLVASKQLPMVMDISDASTQTVDIRIKLRKGSDPNYVKQVLYTKTQVQVSVSVNFEVVQGTDPGRFSYKQYLSSFIQQRIDTKFRLYCSYLKDCATRANQLTAYVKLIKSGEIDNVIAMVKKQTNIDDNYMIDYLVKKIHVTDLQARFILDTNIARLSAGYLKKYEAELKDINQKISVYENVITDGGATIRNEIDAELVGIEKKYGTPRLCTISHSVAENDIPGGTFKIVITRKNFIRKLPDSDKINIIRGDDPKFILKVDNRENILLFDNVGKVFKMPINKIPVTDKAAMGTDIRVLCKNLTADIIAVYYEPIIKKIVEGNRKHYIVVATKNNTIKKLDMEDFLNVATSGLMYSKLKDGDLVTGIIIAPADLDVVIYSKQKALRTSMKNVPLFKRNASGNKAMNTTEDIEGVAVVYPNTNYIIIVTERGRINKFPISEFASHDRARAGINVIKLKPGDSIKAIYGANDTDALRIVTTSSVIEYPINAIKVRSSIAPGDQLQLKGASIIRCDLMWQK